MKMKQSYPQLRAASRAIKLRKEIKNAGIRDNFLAFLVNIWYDSFYEAQLSFCEKHILWEGCIICGLNFEILGEGPADDKRRKMKDNIKYYVVKQKALPEVLLKVAEANRLIETQNISVAEATENVGISRSSFYKYKDDIFPFRDNAKGKTITFVLSMDDEPGLLSAVLNKVAEFRANILTIHQTIPVNGIASLTLSVEILSATGDSSMMIEEIEQLPHVRYLKILSSDASL